jgi:hypothetical protein
VFSANVADLRIRMRFSLDVIRAGKGDCLMLHCGSKKEPSLIMIDGGPSGIYARHLRPRIERIRKASKLDDETPLSVDVLMVSHVDDDHIQGVLDLTSELRDQRANREPQLLSVRSLWHNTFDDLLSTTPKELDAAAGFGAAALSGTIEVAGDEELDAAKVLASIPQGRTLRDDAAFLSKGTQFWKLNQEFKGKLIVAADPVKKLTLDGGVTMTVIGPMQHELVDLQRDHDEWLRQQKKSARKRAESSLAAFIDASVTNLSSLVLLAQAGRKRMLLTGDARGDKILDGLQSAGLLKAGTSSTMHVDLLKVPHHGSANNVETSFFERVTADHYVFSGNGEHGNPERETLEMLFAARGKEPFVMHFTYPFDEVDAGRKADWAIEQEKERRKGKKPRPNWSPKKRGLVSFFADRKLASGQKIEICPDGAPHVIDLLDPLGV